MNTIATQRKPLSITKVVRFTASAMMNEHPNAVEYLRMFLRSNPNRPGQVTIVGYDHGSVARWIEANPNHPEVDEFRILELRFKPLTREVTVIKDDKVLTLDSLMYTRDEELNFVPHAFRRDYGTRYSDAC